jgi:hypothetical protein
MYTTFPRRSRSYSSTIYYVRPFRVVPYVSSLRLALANGLRLCTCLTKLTSALGMSPSYSIRVSAFVAAAVLTREIILCSTAVLKKVASVAASRVSVTCPSGVA